ncbi:MAG: Sec23/Sec24 zinc finger-containing protein [Paludibacteraceae bacterium]|nr:Sec23/Sec24 zinc finger-containing protein [Paludibacteraceae bacterium]
MNCRAIINLLCYFTKDTHTWKCKNCNKQHNYSTV